MLINKSNEVFKTTASLRFNSTFFFLPTHSSFFLQSCSNSECWSLQCNVGLLGKGTTAVLSVRSRIWAETFVEVCGNVTSLCTNTCSHQMEQRKGLRSLDCCNPAVACHVFSHFGILQEAHEMCFDRKKMLHFKAVMVINGCQPICWT